MLIRQAIILKGAERFSEYQGYGNTFEWKSPHFDATERFASSHLYYMLLIVDRDKYGRLKTAIVAIDAIKYRDKHSQFTERCV